MGREKGRRGKRNLPLQIVSCFPKEEKESAADFARVPGDGEREIMASVLPTPPGSTSEGRKIKEEMCKQASPANNGEHLPAHGDKIGEMRCPIALSLSLSLPLYLRLHRRRGKSRLTLAVPRSRW